MKRIVCNRNRQGPGDGDAHRGRGHEKTHVSGDLKGNKDAPYAKVGDLELHK